MKKLRLLWVLCIVIVTVCACALPAHAETMIPIDVTDIHSAHNYSNNTDKSWYVSYPGASAIEITFSSSTSVEEDYDYIYLYKADNTLYRKYTDTDLAGKTIKLSGDTIRIRLTSDESEKDWGFALTSAYAYLSSPQLYDFDVSDIQSPHNYKNNCNLYWTITYPNAEYISITFSPNTSLQTNHDYLEVHDKDGILIGSRYTGTQLAGQTVTVQGNEITLNMYSDSSGTAWGFALTGAQAYSPTKLCRVQLGSVTNGTLTLDHSGNLVEGTMVTITAAPDTGFSLDKICVNGEAISGTSFYVQDDSTVTAQFKYSAAAVLCNGVISPLTGSVAPYGQKLYFMAAGCDNVQYTLDGSDPTTSPTARTFVSTANAFTLTSDTVVKAVAVKNGSFGPVSTYDLAVLAGEGTWSYPYQIFTKKQLNAVRENLSAYYVLGADIVFTAEDFASGGAFSGGWAPIGWIASPPGSLAQYNPFTGTFDGNGHTISGLVSTHGGLFYDNGGTIRDVNVLDHRISGDYQAGFGAIAYKNSGNIYACVVSSAYTQSDYPSQTSFGVGGVVANNSGVIRTCVNLGNTAAYMGYNYGGCDIGGICYRNEGEVSACVNYGDVFVIDTARNHTFGMERYAGGISGQSNSVPLGTITNCANYGSVTGSATIYYGIGGNASYSCSVKSSDAQTLGTGLTSCYWVTSTDKADYPELDFTNNWLMSELGPIPQGLPTVKANGSLGGTGWILYSDGRLALFGEGAVSSLSTTAYPWYSYRNSITSLSIADSITALPKAAFYNYTSLTAVTGGSLALDGSISYVVLDHVLVKTDAVDATCTKAGNSAYYTCTRCGKYFSDEAGTTEIAANSWGISALDHDLSDWASDGDATHTRHCLRSGCEYSETEAHAWDDGVQTKAATCTEADEWLVTCTVCDKTRTESRNAALGHSFSNYVSDSNATCTEDGTKTAVCDHDGCTETDTVTDIGSALGHTLVHHEEISARFRIAGMREYWYCEVCNKCFSDEACENECTEEELVIPACIMCVSAEQDGDALHLTVKLDREAGLFKVWIAGYTASGRMKSIRFCTEEELAAMCGDDGAAFTVSGEKCKLFLLDADCAPLYAQEYIEYLPADVRR